MIIVHFGEYVSGGVATYLENLIREQCENEAVSRVYLFCSRNKSQQMNIKSDKFVQVYYDYKRSLVGLFRLFQILKQCEQVHPSVIHIHSTFAGFSRFTLFFKRRNCPVIYCPHGWAFLQPLPFFSKMILRISEYILSFVTDAIINISQHEQEAGYSIGIKKSRLFWVKTGLSFPEVNSYLSKDFENFLQDHKTALRIGYVGRFDRLKGIDVLIKAFTQLRRDSVLVLVGSPVLQSSVNIPEDSRIYQTGWLTSNQVTRVMNEFDLVVVPSRSEGFGLVAYEAIHNRIPVIASNVGALPELVQDDISGFTFPSEDSEQLKRILEDITPNVLERLKIGTREIDEKQGNAATMSQDTFRIYEDSMEKFK